MKCRVVEEDTEGRKIFIPQYKQLFWWRDFTYFYYECTCRHVFSEYVDACAFVEAQMKPEPVTTKRIVIEFEK